MAVVEFMAKLFMAIVWLLVVVVMVVFAILISPITLAKSVSRLICRPGGKHP